MFCAISLALCAWYEKCFFLILLDLLKDPVASEQIVEFWIGMLKGETKCIFKNNLQQIKFDVEFYLIGVSREQNDG